MDNLSGVYYLVQLILRHILAFLRDFVFREFTWFAPAEEDLDNTSSKIQAIAPQHPIADFFVFLVICGLLFAFMILSTNSPKSETSNYNMNNIETISMAFEEDPSSFWYSRTAGLSCFHACDDSSACGPSRDIAVAPKVQNISRPAISNTRVLSQSRISNYNTRSSCIKHSQKTQADRPVSQVTPQEWLIRRTRSGHVYGKYPI